MAITLQQYINQRPDFKVTGAARIIHSGGVMTCIDLDGTHRFRWDYLNTAAYRKHEKHDSDEEFFKFAKQHILRWLTKLPDDVVEVTPKINR